MANTDNPLSRIVKPPMTCNLIDSQTIDRHSHKSLVLSSQQMSWQGILVEQYQFPPNFAFEANLPAQSAHRLSLPLGQPFHLTQKYDNRLHESFTKCGLCPIVHKGDLILLPAGQPIYWRTRALDTSRSILNIHLTAELVTQITEISAIDGDRGTSDLTHCFSQSDPHLQQIGMMLLAELESGGIMGELYVQSLTQVLVIHLLRHYSALRQITKTEQISLPNTRLQSAFA